MTDYWQETEENSTHVLSFCPYHKTVHECNSCYNECDSWNARIGCIPYDVHNMVSDMY
jgi:hypothetical protein